MQYVFCFNVGFVMEEWKEICGYEGLYEISSFGRVKSVKGTEKILKQNKNSKKYYEVKLFKNNIGTNKKVHRLVAEAFCDKLPGCDVVNHKDNNQLNNNADNLEWTTQKGNVRHAMAQGRMRCGENRIKATEASKKMCVCVETGVIYNSLTEAASKTGIRLSLISKACLGNLKSAKGYHFEFYRQHHETA